MSTDIEHIRDKSDEGSFDGYDQAFLEFTDYDPKRDEFVPKSRQALEDWSWTLDSLRLKYDLTPHEAATRIDHMRLNLQTLNKKPSRKPHKEIRGHRPSFDYDTNPATASEFSVDAGSFSQETRQYIRGIHEFMDSGKPPTTLDPATVASHLGSTAFLFFRPFN